MSSAADYATIADLVEDMASKHGERHAVRHLRRQSIDDWSYERIADNARRLAAGLLADPDDKLEPGESVALFAASRPEWVIACLGIMRAGGVATPLDVQIDDDALDRIIKDAGIRHVFTDRSQRERLEQIDSGQQLRIHLLDADGEEGHDNDRSWKRLLAKKPAEGPEVDPDDRAAMFYTSGTTGPPKGVPLTHANFAAQLAALREENLIDHGDPMLVPLPFHHVYPFVIGILAPLSLGATIVLPRSRTGPELVRALHETGVTHIIGVPRFYRAMHEGLESKAKNAGFFASTYFTAASRLSAFAHRRLGLAAVGGILMRPFRQKFGPKLRLLASGGSPLDPELAWKLESLGWRVSIGYGLTETSPLLTMLKPGDTRFDTVGKPIHGVKIRIDPAGIPGTNSDEETDQDEEHRAPGEAGPGEEGEVLAKGPNVFSGYHELPEATEKAFTDGWYRTGDLGHLDKDGYLHLSGRASTLIITEGGKNIQPDQVEETYAEHPRIREIGVLQRDNKLVALIVPKQDGNDEDDADSAEQGVRRAVEEQSKQLPSYQRIEGFSITKKSLPRTRLGKLRRHKLEEMYDSAGEQPDKPEPEKSTPIAVDEMSEEHRALVRQSAPGKVWDWLSERYEDRRLTPDSNPRLDLGIDSMEWLNLTMQIGERTGVVLEEDAIGEVESIRELLELVAQASEEGGEKLSKPVEEPDAVLTEEQKGWLEPLRGVRWFASRVLRKSSRPVVRLYFRLRARGLENIPTDRTIVFAPNHLSHLDPFIIAAALDDDTLDRTHWGAWTGVARHNPLNRVVSRLAQAVPIDPDRAVVSSIALGSAVLERDRNLVWFPEGQRSEDGKLQDFRPGIGMLLEHHREVVVIPVFIQGTDKAMPVGGFLPKPRRVEIVFGEALSPEQLEERSDAENTRDRITQALRERVAALNAS
ncbi:MAG: AMP-binding protein [Phycisphaerales bacterium]|nr:AMP-binding protein [Planctomycetota bacterium]MCH8507620.1 AMP-binding protein [Phycisphaerales bacterium]